MTTGGGAPFVGRDAELATLLELVDRAAQGCPQVAVVEGPAGIGKTALVNRLLAERPDVASMWASGDEAESALAFGVLAQFYRLRGASEPGGGAVWSDPLAAGAQLLEWLANVAPAGPLVVVVDDVQWADGASLGAVAFMVRRLVAERVVLVFVCRDGESARLPSGLGRILAAETVTRLVLGGLGTEDLVELAAELGRPRLGPGAARRLQAHTGGNPLHARALLDELDRAALSEVDLAPLPAPASFAALVAGRLAQRSPAARKLAAAASVLGLRWRLSDAARVAAVDDPLPLVDELVEAALVEAGPRLDDARFAHVLVQAAIYHHLTPGRRAEWHRAAAGLAGTEEEGLRHRAAGALGPDPGLAAEIAAVAADRAGRGAWGPAAAGYLTAADLDEGVAAQRWLLLGVECLIESSDMQGALSRRELVEACAPGAQREYVRGFLALVSGDRDGGTRLLEQAWAQVGSAGDGDGAAISKIASRLAMVTLSEGRAEDALTFAGRAIAASTRPADLGAGRAIWAFAFGFGEVDRFEDGIAQLGDPPRDPGGLDCAAVGSLLGRGVLRLWNDQPHPACADLADAEAAAQQVAPLYLRLLALGFLADAEYRVGRWDDASTHAELAASLGADAGGVWTLGLFHAVAVFPAAGRGEWARAEAHLAAANAVAGVVGDPVNALWVAVAGARLAQARGDADGVLAVTDGVEGLRLPHGIEEPAIQPWAPLRVDALVDAGRLDDAEALLHKLQGWVARRDNHTARVGVARLAGRLAAARGHLERAEGCLARARAIADNHHVRPFEAGLAQLDSGRLALQQDRMAQAVEHLRVAQEIFERLAAAPFAARCAQELAACGISTTALLDPFHDRLSSHEQAVATLVAEGLTNRQVAAHLVLSTKTVEFHLHNIFAKLGLRNRVELATLHVRAAAPPAP